MSTYPLHNHPPQQYHDIPTRNLIPSSTITATKKINNPETIHRRRAAYDVAENRYDVRSSYATTHVLVRDRRSHQEREQDRPQWGFRVEKESTKLKREKEDGDRVLRGLWVDSRRVGAEARIGNGRVMRKGVAGGVKSRGMFWDRMKKGVEVESVLAGARMAWNEEVQRSEALVVGKIVGMLGRYMASMNATVAVAWVVVLCSWAFVPGVGAVEVGGGELGEYGFGVRHGDCGGGVEDAKARWAEGLLQVNDQGVGVGVGDLSRSTAYTRRVLEMTAMAGPRFQELFLLFGMVCTVFSILGALLPLAPSGMGVVRWIVGCFESLPGCEGLFTAGIPLTIKGLIYAVLAVFKILAAVWTGSYDVLKHVHAPCEVFLSPLNIANLQRAAAGIQQVLEVCWYSGFAHWVSRRFWVLVQDWRFWVWMVAALVAMDTGYTHGSNHVESLHKPLFVSRSGIAEASVVARMG